MVRPWEIFFMGDGAVNVEGTEARQDELTIEEDSIGSGTTDSDGAQARGAESGGKIL